MAIYMVFILNFSRVSLKLDEKRPYLPVVNGLINTWVTAVTWRMGSNLVSG